MSTLWEADVPGCTGSGAVETLPPGDSMTLLGQNHNHYHYESIMVMVMLNGDDHDE